MNTQATIDKGCYLQYSENKRDEAMEYFIDALLDGDKKALEYIFDENFIEPNRQHKRAIMDCIQTWITELKNLDIETLSYCANLEEYFQDKVKVKPATDILVKLAKTNDINALNALGCIVYDSLPGDVADIFEYTNLARIFMIQFFIQGGNPFTIKAYFKYGIYVEKDERMYRIFDDANSRYQSIRDKYEKELEEYRSRIDFENPENNDNIGEEPRYPEVLSYKITEIFRGPEDDVKYFMDWLKAFYDLRGNRKYVVAGILASLSGIDINYPHKEEICELAYDVLERYSKDRDF